MPFISHILFPEKLLPGNKVLTIFFPGRSPGNKLCQHFISRQWTPGSNCIRIFRKKIKAPSASSNPCLRRLRAINCRVYRFFAKPFSSPLTLFLITTVALTFMMMLFMQFANQALCESSSFLISSNDGKAKISLMQLTVKAQSFK